MYMEPPVVLKTLAEFNRYSKSRAGWTWNPDGHTDGYVFIEDSRSGYWHVRCPKHERSGGTLLDSAGIEVNLRNAMGDHKTLLIRHVHMLKTRCTAIVTEGDVGDEDHDF